MFKMDMCNCLKIKSAQLLKNLTSRKFLVTLFVFMMIFTGAQAETYYSGVVKDRIQARSVVFEERGLELCQEFNRKFDLLRWGLYLKVMNATDNIRINTTVRSVIRTQKNLLYAIPTNEIAENVLIGGNNYGS